MGVAVDGQEVEVELREATHRGFHRRADVVKLHVQEDALALFLLELVGQCQPAPGQHPQPDLVEGHGVAQRLRQFEPGQRVGHVQRHDQSVVHAAPP